MRLKKATRTSRFKLNAIVFSDTVGLIAYLIIDPAESVLCFLSMLFLPGDASLFAVVQYLTASDRHTDCLCGLALL